MIALRPYQLDGVEQTRIRYRSGRRVVLLVAPTGAGKTVIAAHVIASALARGSRVLVVAHRRELITQTVDKLERMGVEPAEIGVIMATHPRRRPVARVQVASIDTLRNRTKPAADLVIIDEAHRALSKSYRELVAAYPSAKHLGLTATPYRADGRGLGEIYEDLVVVASPRELIDMGFLVEPRVWSVPAAALPDLTGVETKGGDYDERQLESAVNTAKLIGNIVEHWQERAGGVRTVAFAVSVQHSKNIALRFVEAGVPAEHLDGETPAAERDATLTRLESGATRVVSNCGVLCEGWDQPSVKCAILARPTKSTGLFLQQAGRILRPWQGVGAVILDHAGNAAEHGLPQDDREFTLETRKKKKAGEAPSKTCPECYAVLQLSVMVCPECGYEFEKPALETEAGDLVEIVAENSVLVAWRRVVDEWRENNERRRLPRKPGWCFFRFKALYGRMPPKGATWPKLTRAQEDALANAALSEMEALA